VLHAKLCQDRQNEAPPPELQPERFEKLVLESLSHTVRNILYDKQCVVSSTFLDQSLKKKRLAQVQTHIWLQSNRFCEVSAESALCSEIFK
jgi:hypothetical protein